jgi:hypothetical protein
MTRKEAFQRCDVCNSPLFEVIPFKTTQQEIVNFIQQSSLPAKHKEMILQERWMHPGQYCPNGCTTILVEYGPPKLPDMTSSQAIAIGRTFSQRNHQEFIRAHGENSRIVACVHCRKFRSARLEGKSETALYRNPKFRPLQDSKIISAKCDDPHIQILNHAWWQDQGQEQPECPYFQPEPLFHWTYKSIIGWSEYPKSK